MTIFVTGTTGYLGSYVANDLLTKYPDRLALLVRAKSTDEAKKRLWKSLQLHMDFQTFRHFLEERIDIYLGDISKPDLGLESPTRARLVQSIDSIIHCAASLNRKSEKTCLNVNLRGTLHMIRLAREVHGDHGLRRFSEVSTVAVAGVRQNETVSEDQMIEWDRRDYDPYARTKKFCEAMIGELLPDVPHTVFRPSIVMGDTRFAETTQFDMVRAFVSLAKLRVVPFSNRWRADIIPADYVSHAITTIHQKEKPKYDSYNLSSGTASLSYRDIVGSLVEKDLVRPNLFLSWLAKPFGALVNLAAAMPRGWKISSMGSLLKVFLPYLTFNTVFQNRRVVEELGESPKPFSTYSAELFRFATEGNFTYPHQPWPEEAAPNRKVANV